MSPELKVNTLNIRVVIFNNSYSEQAIPFLLELLVRKSKKSLVSGEFMKLVRVEEQIKMLIAEITMFSEDEILTEDKLVDLGIGTQKIAMLIASVEELFGIVLDKSKVNATMTVQAFVDLVDSCVEG